MTTMHGLCTTFKNKIKKPLWGCMSTNFTCKWCCTLWTRQKVKEEGAFSFCPGHVITSVFPIWPFKDANQSMGNEKLIHFVWLSFVHQWNLFDQIKVENFYISFWSLQQTQGRRKKAWRCLKMLFLSPSFPFSLKRRTVMTQTLHFLPVVEFGDASLRCTCPLQGLFVASI